MKYCFRQDDDAHWFLVPVDKICEFEEHINSIYLAQDDPTADESPEPEGVEMIDGSPEHYCFEYESLERRK